MGSGAAAWRRCLRKGGFENRNSLGETEPLGSALMSRKQCGSAAIGRQS
jgi:hypothetical protein